MNRVKYYSFADWSSGESFIRALELLENYQSGSITHINDAIEFWNVRKFFDNGARHKDHDEQRHERLDKMSKKAAGEACSFFAREMKHKGVRAFLNETDRGFRDDFWELCCVTHSLDLITDEDIVYLFEEGEIAPHQFFSNKMLVKHFSPALFVILKSKPEQYAHMILNDRFAYHDAGHKQLFYPDEFDDDELIALTEAYIASPFAHPNYLSLITTVDAKSGFTFPPKVRLAAKRRYEELWKETIDKGSGITFGYGVGATFRKDQSELVTVEKIGNNFQYFYSWDWVNENRDYFVLLMNFIHLFRYADRHYRITLFSKKSELGLIERLFTAKTEASYVTSTSFQCKQMAAQARILTYKSVLDSFGIRLEELIEWFFNDFINEAFGLPSFDVSLPSRNSSGAEKCRSIAPELEAILKRFGLFVRNGAIEEEILPLVKSEKFRDVPSTIADKYVYGSGSDFERASYYLCSDQCMLAYCEHLNKEADNFFELLLEEHIEECHIPRYEQESFNWLRDNQFIEANPEENRILPTRKAHVIFDLYKNDFMVLGKQQNETINAIKSLKDDGFVQFGSTLFAQPEADYFSYIMNNESFDNALALRNRYEHGDPIPEEQHENNYSQFLILLVLTALKIYDELDTSLNPE